MSGQCCVRALLEWEPRILEPKQPDCETAMPTEFARTKNWQWWVSGLLLMATMINYMDRQTLSNLSVRITERFQLNEEQYGDMEFVFGVSFAIGALFFGIVADKVSVRWLYPAVLTAWSAIGFATGLTNGYWSMLICRALLGFFEAGHWPCALIVTQAIMARGERLMGNSVLQSGASIGAIVTPLIIRWIVADDKSPDAWRSPFMIIGAFGLVWAALWLYMIRTDDLPSRQKKSLKDLGRADENWLVSFLLNPRFWALATVIVTINIPWQLIRAWLPKFLQQGRGYTEAQSLYFNSAYYIATDVGCIATGFLSLWLIRRLAEVNRARIIVYAGCCILAAMTVVVAMLPSGWVMLAVLLVVGAGTLGLFPCYYSLTQELGTEHMGRLTGVLSFIGWLASSPSQKLFGRLVDQTGSYDLGLALAGCSPFIGFAIFWFLWNMRTDSPDSTQSSSSS